MPPRTSDEKENFNQAGLWHQDNNLGNHVQQEWNLPFFYHNRGTKAKKYQNLFSTMNAEIKKQWLKTVKSKNSKQSAAMPSKQKFWHSQGCLPPRLMWATAVCRKDLGCLDRTP